LTIVKGFRTLVNVEHKQEKMQKQQTVTPQRYKELKEILTESELKAFSPAIPFNPAFLPTALTEDLKDLISFNDDPVDVGCEDFYIYRSLSMSGGVFVPMVFRTKHEAQAFLTALSDYRSEVRDLNS